MDILHGRQSDVVHSLLREESLVRSHNHVRHHQQQRQLVIVQHLVRTVLVEELLFLLIHVEGSRTDFMGAQTRDKVLRTDQFAAARIDDHHPVLHLLDGPQTDQELRIVRQRTVQRDDVRIGIERRQVHHLHLIRLCKLLVGIHVVSQDIHAEAPQNLDQFLRDAPHADNARRLTVHVETHQTVQLEVTLTRTVHRTIHLTVQRQHQRHGILRHAMR